LYRYLDRQGLLVDGDGRRVGNPAAYLEAPTVSQRANDWLRSDEDEAVLRAATQPAERIIVATLRFTGLRSSEACSLRVTDFALGEEPSVRVRESKTSRGRRTIPLLPEYEPVVCSWLDYTSHYCGITGDGPFLAPSRGTSMRPPYLWRVVTRVGERAGVRVIPCTCGSQILTRHAHGCPRGLDGGHRSHISPHTLRRTFGSHLLNQGVRIEVISRLLGHSNTAITERAYAELEDATIRRELMQAIGTHRARAHAPILPHPAELAIPSLTTRADRNGGRNEPLG
jgi:integrase/recombinase XerD